MVYQEIGIASDSFKKILSGEKKVEGRLNKGKFKEFDEGIIITLREDFYEDGKLVRSEHPGVAVQVTGSKVYSSFEEMLKGEGLHNVLPAAKTIGDGVAVYRQYYSEADEQQYGVLALRIEVFEDFEFPTD